MSGAWGGRGPRHIYATDAQLNYLRRLNNECFAQRVPGFYIDSGSRILKSEASSMISTLLDRLGRKDLRVGEPSKERA